jgi:hypothetical protein
LVQCPVGFDLSVPSLVAPLPAGLGVVLFAEAEGYEGL